LENLNYYVCEATKALVEFNGPAYLRVGSGREKRIFDKVGVENFKLMENPE